MSKTFSPAQKKAYAIKMAKLRANAAPAKVSGYGAYRKKAPAARTTVKRTVVRGRGAYKKDYGSRLGSVVGEGLQELLGGVNPMAMLTGFGSYESYVKPNYRVKKNSLVVPEGNGPPTIRNQSDGTFVISYREYICDVKGSTEFQNLQLPINPGLQQSFPWLCMIAQGYEQWAIQGMIYEFRSTYSDAATASPALGTVVLSTEYDSSRGGFKNKQEAENHQYSTSCKPSENLLHIIECANKSTPLTELYVRQGALPPNSDIKTYDFGIMQVVTQGMPTNDTVGEIWCSYEIRLLKPCIPSVGNLVLADYYENTGTISTSTYFGNLDNIQSSTENNLGVSLTNTTISFPKTLGLGAYLLTYEVSGSAGAAASILPTISNIVGTLVDDGNASAPFQSRLYAPASGEVVSRFMKSVVIYLDGTEFADQVPQIEFTGGSFPPSTSQLCLYITSIRSGMNVTTIEDSPMMTYASYIKHIKMAMKAKAKQVLEQQPEDDSDTDEDNPRAYLNGKYSLEELRQVVKAEDEKAKAKLQPQPTPASSPKDEGEWDDMSKSTMERIQSIVATAKAKKANA